MINIIVNKYIYQKNMIIERTKDEVVFRLAATTPVDDLQDIVDLLEYKEITRNSKVSQKEVDNMVKTIKKGRWEKTRKKMGI